MEKEELKHHLLILYNVKNLQQKDKVKFLRKLQGYQEKKAGKLYKHPGLVHKVQGKKLGSNVMLVPINGFTELQNFFSRNNVQTEVKEVWVS